MVCLAVGIFIFSSLTYAVGQHSGPVALPMTAASTQLAAMTRLGMPGIPDVVAPLPDGSLGLHSLFLQPEDPVLWSLLVAVWIALTIHAFGVLRRQHRTELAGAVASQATPAKIGQDKGDAGPPTAQQLALRHSHDNDLAEHAPLALALLAGAAWPWLIDRYQASGFVLALAMLSLALAAAVRGQRDGSRIRRMQTVGLFAGWATAVTYAAFATLLNDHLGIPAVASTVTAMLLCAAAGVIIQLRLGGAFCYSVAIIWSLVGLALATMQADATIAMMAIIGISAMAIVLVRAAS